MATNKVPIALPCSPTPDIPLCPLITSPNTQRATPLQSSHPTRLTRRVSFADCSSDTAVQSAVTSPISSLPAHPLIPPPPPTAKIPLVHSIPLLPTDKATIQASVAEANSFATILGLRRLISEGDLTDIFSEAFIAASGEYSIRAAQAWAQGYSFPPGLLQRDLTVFQEADNDLLTFCTNRQSSLQHERLSLSRVVNCFGTMGELIPGVHFDDFRRLCTVATEGIQLHLPEGFYATSQPQPLRTTYVKVSQAVHKMLAA
jgi:hypothetical protein